MVGLHIPAANTAAVAFDSPRPCDGGSSSAAAAAQLPPPTPAGIGQDARSAHKADVKVAKAPVVGKEGSSTCKVARAPVGGNDDRSAPSVAKASQPSIGASQPSIGATRRAGLIVEATRGFFGTRGLCHLAYFWMVGLCVLLTCSSDMCSVFRKPNFTSIKPSHPTCRPSVCRGMFDPKALVKA